MILRLQDSELNSLPYDLLSAGRRLAFDLGSLFPNLSYPVLEHLEQKHFDSLFIAQEQFLPDILGNNATKDFILRHVFKIAPELITTEVELLRELLRYHYGNNELPYVLSQRLIQILRSNSTFNDWALEDIFRSAAAFYMFLEERWPLFISSVCKCDKCSNDLSDINFHNAGPSTLSFAHEDIRVYIDNLFVEGKLSPLAADNIKIPSDTPEWIRSGLVFQSENHELQRARRLMDSIRKEVPNQGAAHKQWLVFAAKWAELCAILHSQNLAECSETWQEIATEIDIQFQSWLKSHYASLMTLPPQSPAMLHHVPRCLARDIERSKQTRVALIVVDGLSYDQWITVRNVLHQQDDSLLIHESSTFAWIPTITSVSRQSLFAGKPPLYFPNSIGTTSREPNLWQQFWQNVGLSRQEIDYRKGLGTEYADVVMDKIDLNQVRVLGLVIDKVDKIMHGRIQLPSATVGVGVLCRYFDFGYKVLW